MTEQIETTNSSTGLTSNFEQPKKETTASKVAEGTKENAGALGAGLPVIGMWLLTAYGGVDVPAEVATAIGGILGALGGAIGARVRRVL